MPLPYREVSSMSLSLGCTSRIESVVVYARGAMVTRRIDTPASWPDGPVDLVVSGISPWAEPGAIRSTASGNRRILGIQSRLVLPEATKGAGDTRARLLGFERENTRLQAERDEIANRRKNLTSLRLRPIVNSRSICADPAGRFGDALASDQLLDELLRDLDSQLAAVDSAMEDNRRGLAAAQAEFDQSTSAARSLPGHPTWEITIQLSAAQNDDSQASTSFAATSKGQPAVEISYPVGAARWWPAYSARMSSTSERAELALEAFVAQSSFEDWTSVRIGLCTADLTQDTRLPELPSLRIGRAQPPKRTGFRPVPKDLDSLFEAFDETMRVARASLPPRSPEKNQAKPKSAKQRLKERQEQTMPPLPPAAACAPPPMSAPMGYAAGAVASAAPAQRRSMMKDSRKRAAAPEEDGAPSDEYLAEEETQTDEQTPPIEPTDTWLDFDALTLAPGDASERRGRLVRAMVDSRGSMLAAKAAEIERAAPASRPCDPRNARGQFDHLFDAEGTVDVPSNAIPHRIVLTSAEANTRRRFRAVPLEVAEIFREALLENPFPAPLLGGPVEVFMDGGLLATPFIDPVGRGGTLSLGLGVEDRLRVSRNARIEENSRGLLGGTTGIEHAIEIEVASALGQAIELEILDRIPVTDEKDAKITLLHSEPKAAEYDQAERGTPIRGGLRWSLKVPAGGKAKIAWTYRIDLPAKNEIVGGNRRD
jgi:hypothetical protein